MSDPTGRALHADAALLCLDMRPGWPPDGASGIYLGFDANNVACLLKWLNNKWGGVRFAPPGDPRSPRMPQTFLRVPAATDYVRISTYVVRHTRLPDEKP